MQAVMAKTNEICLRYLDNSVLCSLPAPSNTYYETSIFAARNRRRKMEDRHVAIHDLNTMFNIQEASPSSYYAIFDGHAGHDAAAYSSAHLHQFLSENKYFISNPEQALLDAFCKTDALFLEKCKVENLSGGTTAVVALLRPKEKTLYIAWVGDSQALLVKQGTILQCVNPHKPSREDERERIEKTGGCVMLWGTWRVNGQLAVSRAIGDADYKPCVIAIPDVKEISLDGYEDFLIIACDGLWDSLSEDAAAQEVYYMVAENPDDTERISKRLVHLARYQGSTDNISVIVVFLREPHKIAAEAHRWATRNGPPLPTDNMEAGLDNANNPFTNSNGSLKNLDVETDNIHLQKSGDGLLLNLTDNFKANGTELSQDIFEKSNGTKKSASDIHFDDEFGPETDVDAVDDAFSPVEKTKAFLDELTKGYNDESRPKSFNDEVKAFSEGIANNNPLDDGFNPFLNKVVEDINKDKDFEEHGGDNREETPTPPIDTVHDVGGLEENPAESDSEDEWNYFKGDQAKPETLTSQPETVVETSELEDAMSQLNPDAAEFVPVSPTRSIPSPACRALINDEVISQSPKRPLAVDIKVPNETEFESEVKSRPSDFNEYSNGHDSDSEHNISGSEQLDNILNGKSLDDIPDFQPGSTPAKHPLTDEFHFGPNAAPFTPKPLDQSEAFSTKANYGDDTEQTLNTSFNDSELAIPVKDFGDPMSMSFSAERGESNPFQENDDLNKVHDLPENLEEFLGKNEGLLDDDKENRILDDTISDLPEHDVLGSQLLDNDRAAIQTTDLDKLSQDDEKELASPLEPDQEDFTESHQNDLLKAQESNLLEGFVVVPEKITTDDSNVSSLPELEAIPVEHAVSPIPELQPESGDSRLSPLPGELDSRAEEDHFVSAPLDLLSSKSALPEETNFLQSESPLAPEADLHESKSPIPIESDLHELESPIPLETDFHESKSPIPIESDLHQLESPTPLESDFHESKSPIPVESDLHQLESPTPLESDFHDSKSPVPEEASLLQSKSPLSEEAELPQSESPILEKTSLLESKSPPPVKTEVLQSRSPVPEDYDLVQSLSPVPDPILLQSKSPVSEQDDLFEPKSPVPPEEKDMEKLIDVNVDVHQVKEHEGLGGLESQSPVCEFTSKTKTPFDDVEDLKPTNDMFETEFNPKSEVENIHFGAKSPNFFNEPAKSPVLACEYSAEVHPQSSGAIPESHSPLDLQQEEKHEEDITSSVKDDISSPMEPMSPVKSPDPQVVESLIDDHFKQTEWESQSKQEEIHECPIQKEEGSLQQEIMTKTEVPAQEVSSPDLFCPMPLSRLPNEPLVQTNEVNLLEASAPMEPSKFEELSNGIAAFTTEMTEQFSIKTDSIKPEYAEPAIITPSEDSKVIDEAPAMLQPEAPVQELPQCELKMPERTESSQEVVKDLSVLSPLPVATQETKEVKKEEKKSSNAVPKKPIGKIGTSKLSTPPKTSTAKLSPKPATTSTKTGVSPRVPSKTGPIKAPTTTTSRMTTNATAATKPSPKPKTPAAPKPIEKKPLTNGDIKPAPRTTLTKRPSAETTATKTTTRPATAASKTTSPTKTAAAPRPATAPRTAPLKTSTTAARPASGTTMTAKPRVPLSSRTTGTVSGTTTTTKTTTTTANRTSLSPRAPAPPKPRTITSTAPKPRPPISRTITKSADLEKEKKESANKLTASRTTTVTKTTSATATSRTALTTVRKTETKPLSQRTGMSKTTTTTTKTSSTKKPGEIKSVTKTKTTKIEKPKENGIAAANITEEIKELTIVNNVVNETENLLKDNSPLDNKLITETTNSLID